MIKHSCPTIGQAEAKAIISVLKTKYLAQGSSVSRFEDLTVKYIGNKSLNAVAVNSGSSALHLALLSLGISSKDEVIIPNYACSAILNAVNYTGAKPVLTDIDEDDFNINVKSVRNKITKRTRAIVAAHLFGFPADMDALTFLGVPVIEDCAQSIGAAYKNKPVGSFGKLAAFSFYATKMITTGYGGMVISKDNKLINHIRNLIDYDNRNDYIVRYNYQMSDLNAALGIVQLRQLNDFIARRHYIGLKYQKALKSLNLPSLILPKESSDITPVFYRYVIRHPEADKIMRQLNRRGIEVKKPVYKPLHYYFRLNRSDFPVSEKVYRTAISLPIYPLLTDTQINYIIDNLTKILQRY